MIHKICHAFRASIQDIKTETSPFCFRSFPLGCCGHTSEMLALFLAAHGFGEFECVSGTKAHIQTHAWLRKDDLIIDLTADQFEEIDQAVIVTKHSPWHDEFQILNVLSVDYGALFGLNQFYAEICRRTDEYLLQTTTLITYNH